MLHELGNTTPLPRMFTETPDVTPLSSPHNVEENMPMKLPSKPHNSVAEADACLGVIEDHPTKLDRNRSTSPSSASSSSVSSSIQSQASSLSDSSTSISSESVGPASSASGSDLDLARMVVKL
ncbi:hypothetical protein CC86DRAFT_451776, partial [Ophiobolus disseminans]